jgi:hypothetical protein
MILKGKTVITEVLGTYAYKDFGMLIGTGIEPT